MRRNRIVGARSCLWGMLKEPPQCCFWQPILDTFLGANLNVLALPPGDNRRRCATWDVRRLLGTSLSDGSAFDLKFIMWRQH